MIEQKKFYIHKMAAGCYPSSLDCDDFWKLYAYNGYEITDVLEEASVIVVSSCVTGTTRQNDTMREIENVLANRKKGAELIIGGCVDEAFKKNLQEKFGCQIVRPRELSHWAEVNGFSIPATNDHLLRLQDEFFNDKIKKWKMIHRVLSLFEKGMRWVSSSETNPFNRFYNTTWAYSPRTYLLRTAAGCPNSCSFCKTRSALGRFQSRSIPSILAEAAMALKFNYEHFVLVADELASFGSDINTNLAALLNELFSLDQRFTVTLSNMNPANCRKYFDEFLAAVVPGRIKNINYVLQSGSNRTLQNMNRRYTREDFIETALAVLGRDPGITLRTDIIVGFPGETDEDFNDTLDVLRTVPFDTINVFLYEATSGTPAAPFGDPIPKEIKIRRQRKALRLFHRRVLRRWWDYFVMRKEPLVAVKS